MKKPEHNRHRRIKGVQWMQTCFFSLKYEIMLQYWFAKPKSSMYLLVK